jgi:hypothetical protein
LESNPEREGAGMSEQIDKTTKDWLKEIGAESPDAELKNRIGYSGKGCAGTKDAIIWKLRPAQMRGLGISFHSIGR